MPERFLPMQRRMERPAPVSLMGSWRGPQAEAEAQYETAVMDNDRRSQTLGQSLQAALMSSTPSALTQQGTPEVPLPYSMQPEPEGAPSLRGGSFAEPGMPVGADLGAYGGRRQGEERGGGMGRKIAPVLDLLGSLGMGAQAGSRERGGGLGGFLSGMGAGYSQGQRADFAREQMEADRENQQMRSVVDLLKAQSDQARAEADAQYKGIQGQKLAKETELLDPRLQLEQEEQITKRLAAESQASLNQVRAEHEAIKAELAPVYASIRERVGNAQAEKLLNDAALAELEKRYMPQRTERELERLAAQAQSSRAQAGYMGAMTEAIPQREDSRQLAAYAGLLNAQKPRTSGYGPDDALRIESGIRADRTRATQDIMRQMVMAGSTEEQAQLQQQLQDVESYYDDLERRARALALGGGGAAMGGSGGPSREAIRPGRRGSAPTGDPLGILGGP